MRSARRAYSAAFASDGAVLLRGVAAELNFPLLEAHVLDRFESSIAQVKTQQNRPLEVGTNEGWREIVQRARGRYDLTALDSDILSPACILATSLANSVTRDDVKNDNSTMVHIGGGALLATPGCEPHPWHIDGPHLFPDGDAASVHLPVHALNVFIPLTAVGEGNSPTRVLLGSHRKTNVEGGVALKRVVDEAVQRGREGEMSTAGSVPGDVLLFDYRVLHCADGHVGCGGGGGDNSEGEASSVRAVLYFTFARSWFKDAYNFPERSLASLPPLLV